MKLVRCNSYETWYNQQSMAQCHCRITAVAEKSFGHFSQNTPNLCVMLLQLVHSHSRNLFGGPAPYISETEDSFL